MHEALRVLQASLPTINQDYRQAIELRYMQGMAVTEVASVMGRSPHAIHNLCHRALKQLRTVMGQSSEYFSSG